MSEPSKEAIEFFKKLEPLQVEELQRRTNEAEAALHNYKQNLQQCAEKAAVALRESPYGESWRYVADSTLPVIKIILQAFTEGSK